jgi:hypothetical protein
MRKLDPLAVALALTVTGALGTVAYVVGSILSDERPRTPVPYSTDRAEAQKTLDLIRRGQRVPAIPLHR